jgi:urease accessory protein
LALGLLAASTSAMAHTGHGLTTDWMAGLIHPFSGADHLLTMVAIGFWARQIGGKGLWLLPLSFLGCMVLGALLAAGGMVLPYAETAVQAGLLAIGFSLTISAGWMKALPAAAAAGFFAVFHGYLHGVEAGSGSDGLAYGLGFLTSTAALHFVGLLMGLASFREKRAVLAKTFGAMCAGVGLYLMAG